MRTKQIHITLLLGLFCAFFSTAQEVDSSQQLPEVRWGELQRRNGTLHYLLPSGENQFYALRWSGSHLFGHYTVTKHEDLKQVNVARIKLVANKSIANFEGASILDGKFVVFLSDKKDNKNNFYMQEFNENLEIDGDVIHLASYELDRNKGEGTFLFRASPNRKYFGVIWEIPGKRDERHVYGFRVYDAEMKTVNEGEYALPFDAKLSEIHEHLISNSGDYFICVSEYKSNDKKVLFNTSLDYKALHIYRLNDDIGTQDFTLDLDGKPVVAISMYSNDNNIFTLTGIYGSLDQIGVTGVFYQKVNLDTEEVLGEEFKKFDEEFITQDWSDRLVKRAEKRKKNGKGDPELFSYKMRDVTYLEDGSIIGSMEQFYVQVRANSDGRSNQSSNMYYYFYNDIIAYKIDSTGAFSWVVKIPKDQVSINDGGPYSSFESFIDNGKVYFIFNDNVDNYDVDDKFINRENIESANYTRRKNVVSITSIDVNTGEKDRTAFFGRATSNSLVVPKLFSVNYRTGELILYALSGTKEKMGIIRLNPRLNK